MAVVVVKVEDVSETSPVEAAVTATGKSQDRLGSLTHSRTLCLAWQSCPQASGTCSHRVLNTAGQEPTTRSDTDIRQGEAVTVLYVL